MPTGSVSINQGQKKTFSVYLNYTSSKQVDLTNATEIIVSLPSTDPEPGNTEFSKVEFKLSASEVQIIGNPIAGQINVICSGEKTQLLKAGEAQTIEALIVFNGDTENPAISIITGVLTVVERPFHN